MNKSFQREYTDADVINGAITVQHNLGAKWLHWVVWTTEMNGAPITPSSDVASQTFVQQVDDNAIKVYNAGTPAPQTFKVRIRVSR